MRLTTYRWLLRLLSPWILFSGWRRCRRAAQLAKQSPDFVPIEACLAARFGWANKNHQPGGVWIHAVSVGETRSIFPLLKRLSQDLPDCPLTVTSGSTQGAQQALRFAPVPIQHQMMPYDTPKAVNRFLDQLAPALVLMVETEIWPNLYQACFDRGIPCFLINARIKAQSFDAYQKWGGALVRQALTQTQGIACQFEVDRQRFLALGARPENTHVMGNLKFDLDPAAGLSEQAQQWRAKNHSQTRFIWVAASTHEGEEARILQAHQQLCLHHPEALLILAPRHPERFEAVNELLSQQLAPDNALAIRSKAQTVSDATSVYFADSIGEMMLWYQVADVCFVGGSLVPFGGHNILEPASLGKTVLSGPHYSNLQALYDLFIQHQAIVLTPSPTDLAHNLEFFAQNPQARHQQGQRALKNFQAQTGALERLMQLLRPWLPH